MKQELPESKRLLFELEKVKKGLGVQLKKARNALEEEAKLAFNTRAKGQKVRAAVEEIAKKYGVNKGIYFGGNLHGPGCSALLQNRKDIFAEIVEYLCSLPQGQKLVPDGTIKDILGGCKQLTGHFDGIFAICCKKRYHVVEDDILQLEQHVQHACALWRALGHSFTTKMHLIEDHLADMMR